MRQVLVVDDSATMRQLMKMVISKYLPCTIVEAFDGQDALEKLQAGGFDLVITDVNMPRLDGLGLIENVRGALKSDVPIIVVTTKGGEADRDRGLELGANTYLTKPINGTLVGKAIAELLG